LRDGIKNNSEWDFSVFFKKRTKTFFYKQNKNFFFEQKNPGGCFFLKKKRAFHSTSFYLKPFKNRNATIVVITRAAESVEIGKELPGKSYMLAGN